MRWRGQEYGGADADRGGKIQPGGLVGGGGGGIGTHRRGSSATFDSYSSRRSSLGSMAGFGGGLDGDRRYSLEVDACSGTLLPFYFAPAESEGGGGGAGGSGDAAAWAGGGDLSGGGVGGGRVVAEDGSGGGGIAEAEQAAMMMAARRSSLEEALYGACYKRTSFSNAWVRYIRWVPPRAGWCFRRATSNKLRVFFPLAWLSTPSVEEIDRRTACAYSVV